MLIIPDDSFHDSQEPEGWEHCSLCGQDFDDPQYCIEHLCMTVVWEGAV